MECRALDEVKARHCAAEWQTDRNRGTLGAFIVWLYRIERWLMLTDGIEESIVGIQGALAGI